MNLNVEVSVQNLLNAGYRESKGFGVLANGAMKCLVKDVQHPLEGNFLYQILVNVFDFSNLKVPQILQTQFQASAVMYTETENYFTIQLHVRNETIYDVESFFSRTYSRLDVVPNPLNQNK